LKKSSRNGHGGSSALGGRALTAFAAVQRPRRKKLSQRSQRTTAVRSGREYGGWSWQVPLRIGPVWTIFMVSVP